MPGIALCVCKCATSQSAAPPAWAADAEAQFSMLLLCTKAERSDDTSAVPFVGPLEDICFGSPAAAVPPPPRVAIPTLSRLPTIVVQRPVRIMFEMVVISGIGQRLSAYARYVFGPH